jgi:hypothetical protein
MRAMGAMSQEGRVPLPARCQQASVSRGCGRVLLEASAVQNHLSPPFWKKARKIFSQKVTPLAAAAVAAVMMRRRQRAAVVAPGATAA